MARDKELSEDLAAMAADERGRLGEAPSTEELIELRDGRLPEGVAERIRDRLAVDPELAALYLDLKRFSDLGTPVVEAQDADAEVERAWRELSARRGRGTPATKEVDGEVAAFRRRRRSQRAFLALAASVLVGLGAGWMLVERQKPLPEGVYQRVEINESHYRGSIVRISTRAAGVELHVAAARLELPGKFDVELLDGSNRRLRRERTKVRSGEREIVFRVASSTFEDGKAYRLIVRPAGSSPEAPPSIVVGFEVVFDDLDVASASSTRS